LGYWLADGESLGNDAGMVISGTAALGVAMTALGMVLTPGPNMMYLVSRSVGQGRVAGWISLMGTEVGFVVYVVMANLGLALVFVAVPWLYIGVKSVGAAYLGYLAWQALKPGGRGLFETQALEGDPVGKLFRMGLLTNLLNPKAVVMYVALIPQFIDPDRGHTVEQGFILGGVHIAVSTLVNALIVLAAGTIARFATARPRWVVWQRRVTGTLLGAVAVLLAHEVPSRARV
jgi:threonine/homoserine/homoserine lactone efflux protein